MAIKSSVFIALFAAITAVFGIFPPIQIPALGVPITAQSLAVMLAGGILGARRGALSITLFLLLVAVGLPLLAGGRGGLGIFQGPSGGFLIGWIFGAAMTGYLVEKLWNDLNLVTAFIAASIGGILIVYLIGVPWVAYAAGISLTKALIGSSAYIPGDLIKALIAAFVILTVKKSYPVISR
ncbi:MAG: biotin transporter BioY [Alphaproteobacteria bacterium]|nr:biotin transporter BioY [Alphaproteobacteria bacterium]